MRLKLPLIAAALCLTYGINAQNDKTSLPNSEENNMVITRRTCGAEVPSAGWDTWFNKKVEEFKAANASGKTQTGNFVIPVIVHVIHGGQAVGTYPNIKQGQINSQIQVLNADYGGTGYNVASTPTVFTSAIANTGITFCLAQRDTNGVLLAEPGIDRVNYTTHGWANPAAAAYNTPTTFQNYINGTIKPGTIWNPTRYMNIWITDENANTGLLGYATFPSGSGLTGITSGMGTATTDGLWCWAKSFGSNSIFAAGTYDPTYNKGRTATHEIGHWVGLRHTWGDGTCATDYCADTPPSQTANYGCPAFPHNVGTCTGNTTGEMTMNFMDYSDDACMYMFTNDQNTRIQTAMNNGFYRINLTASSATLCGTAPNANFTLAQNACLADAIMATDASTGGATSYTWSSNPATGVNFNTNSVANPTLSFSANGTYTITMIAGNGFGSDTATQVLQVSACTGLKVNSQLSQNIRLVPNPSNGLVNIVASLPTTQVLDVSVTNSLGQIISTVKYNSVTSNTFNLDLSAYSNGVYFVTINNGQEKIVKRLILNK